MARLPTEELLLRLSLLPDSTLDELTRPGLDPRVAATRLERLLEARRPVPLEASPFTFGQTEA